MSRVAFTFVLAAFAAVLGITPAIAQTTSSEISGTVVDPSSALIAGARVTLKSESTSETRSATTNETGLFVFPAVVPGVYTIKVEANGFKNREAIGIVLTANQKRSVGNIALEVGNASESITIEAQGSQVQTGSAENSSLLSGHQLAELSTRGRDVVSLLKLIPGVTPGTDADSLGGTFGTTLPAVNGTSSGFNQVTLDGQSGTDDDITNAFNETTSMDAIAEVKVMMNNYQAEYGRNASAVINMISKSGTREFHGSAYWYKRHESFNANDFFSNRNGVVRPKYRYNTFGGTIGGPIFIPKLFNTSKTKLFAFYSREDQRTITPSAVSTITMPTMLERNGDYSQTLDLNGKVIPITDPTTGKPFPNNVIPSTQIDKYGQAMLNIFKLPNFFNRAISGGNYNYQWQNQAEVPKTQNLLKIDYNPTKNDRISIRPRTWSADTRQYNIFGNFQTNWDFYKQHYLFTDKSIETNWTRIFTPTVVNELTLAFRSLRETDPKLFPTQWDPITRSLQGLEGLGQWYPKNNPNDIIPAMSFGGVPNVANINGEVIGRLPMIDARDYRYNLTDNLSKTWGLHQFKVGIYYEFNVGSEGARGVMNGSFAFAKDVNNPLDTNWAYSNALVGNFQSYTEASNQNTAKNYFTLTEWFAQDSWKVSRRLTLELGMRFSVAPPLWFPNGDAAAFYLNLYNPANAPKLIQPTLVAGKRVGLNPVTGAIMPNPAIGFYAPNSGDPLNGLRAASVPGYDHFFTGNGGVSLSPRLNFAWDVFGDEKTAIRGGIAITRNPLFSNSTFSGAGVNTPPAQYNPTLYYGTLSSFTSASGLLSPPSVSTYGPLLKVPTLYTGSLFVQHDMGHAIIASIGFVGNRGKHLQQSQAVNTLPYGIRFLASSIDPTTNLPYPDNFLRPLPGFTNVTRIEDNGISNYNALQSTVERRFTRGLQFQAGYTWSKAMSDSANRTTYLANRMWNYGMTADDRTHVLTMNYTYDLPKLSQVLPNPVVKGVFDGWALSGIWTVASGAPSGLSFTTTSGADLTGGGDGQRIIVTGPIPIANKAFLQWFNTANVALPAKGSIGNAAITEFRLPGTNNWDMTAFKNFKVKEKVTFQFRWEAYNVFNHTQFAGVNTAARFDSNTGAQTNTLFGQVTSTRTPRVMQGSLRIQF